MFLVIPLFCAGLPAPGARGNPDAARQVRFTRGTLEVPTYTFSRSEAVAPLFASLESMGLYPYARLDRDSLRRKPAPVRYESLTLENEYLRVVLLPELGGRIWSAHDKIAGREIFYRTGVIKPSSYNQRGGWPVGNLEVYGPYDAHMLTWPGEPWPWARSRHRDGSATVVLSHVDHFFRNKLSMAVTLHPGRSFIELTIRLSNNNALPNRYLLWTNAGIPATDGTRFVYPMTRTIAHDSSDLGTWPVSGGVDLSWYKNNKNMLGVFGLDLYDHFIAAYDYQSDYGTICYTNRLLARGVKTWTWGTGETATRQMASYTDADGPYIEVQSGRFVWDGNYEFIEPGKSDGWTEYWYGTGGLGGLTMASRDAAIFLDAPPGHQGTARLAVRATGNFPNAALELKAGESTIWSARQDLKAGSVYHANVELKTEAAGRVLKLEVRSADGEALAGYSLQPDGSHPDAVFADDSIRRKFGPIETLTAEETFNKGLAHEKFGQIEEARQAYEAALAKDGQLTSPHLRLGLMALERMRHELAIGHFKRVLARDPTNSEAHYYLAVAYSELGNDAEAERHYSRLLPSSEKFEQRDYGFGLLALRAGDLKRAAAWLSQAVAATPTQLPMRQAYAIVLRKLGRAAEARKEGEALLQLDSTNAFAHAERIFLAGSAEPASSWAAFDRACARHAQGYLELATEYFKLSAWNEARRVLERGIAAAAAAGQTLYPLLHYYRAYAADRSGDTATARQAIAAARSQQLRIEIFPFRRETINVLNRALAIEPQDANAACLLGEILYSRARREEAQAAWRSAIQSDPHHFSALRDLGMALMEAGQAREALALLTRASRQRPEHLATTILVARLQARAGNAETARQVLERALLLQPRNDRLIENLAWVEAQAGRHERALELLTQHTFEPKHQSYSLLHLYQAARLMAALGSARQGMHAQAIEHARATQRPPASLGVDDFAALQSARLLVFEALLHQVAGDSKTASQTWKAAAGIGNAESGEEGLFGAIALDRVGQTARAQEWFKNFLSARERNQQSDRAEARAKAHYLAGIYSAFQGKSQQASECFRRGLDIDRSDLWAQQALAWLESGLLTRLAR